jgi:hypothetical protein
MSDGTDSGKRTVAELIAKYGDQGSSASRRRHRRRAEDTNETAPQAIIDRVRSDSGYFAPAQPEPTHHNGMDRPAASAPEPAQPTRWRATRIGPLGQSAERAAAVWPAAVRRATCGAATGAAAGPTATARTDTAGPAAVGPETDADGAGAVGPAGRSHHSAAGQRESGARRHRVQASAGRAIAGRAR